MEVLCEWDVEVAKLCCQALIDFVAGLFREEDCGLVTVMEEMAGCYETIATYLLSKKSMNVRIVSYRPLLPGPQATKIFFPLLGGCTR